MNLLIPILTVNISSAVFRFAIDEKDRWKDIFSIGIKYTIIGTLLLTGLLILNNVLKLYEPFCRYSLYLLLLFISCSVFELMGYFARGQERIKEISISGVLGTCVMIATNILLLVVFKLGIDGYFIAMVLSHLVPAFYLFIICKSKKYLTIHCDKEKAKEMIAYSRPLIANSIGWWINNVSDRYVVTFICGIAANGIYSVAYKIPSILTVFQNIFSQAWTLSAVKNYEEKDKTGFFIKVYNLYNCVNVVICSGLIVAIKLIAKFLFQKDFYSAWRYAPFLLISVVFGSLSGYFGSIFSAVKQSKMYGRSTLIGALINIVLNFLLIYCLGPIGAAVATAISYFIVYYIRLSTCKQYIELRISTMRDFVSYALLTSQAVIINLISSNIANICIQIILFIFVIILYLTELKTIGHGILKTINRIKGRKC